MEDYEKVKDFSKDDKNNFEDLSKIKELLRDCNKIIIAGHINPDGDAVGASLGLGLCLKEIGKQPIIILDSYSEKFNFLKGHDLIWRGDVDEINGDAFISLDTAAKDRLSRAEAVFDRTPLTINIDHHISNPKYAKYNFVKTASSTSEIVFDVVKQFTHFTKEIAECIYTGIIFDTGGFKHSTTTASTHIKAAELISTGIDFTEIHRQVMQVHSLSESKILSTALKNIRIEKDYPIAYTYLTLEDMKNAGANFSDLDGIVEHILNLRDIEVSLMATERGENTTKISLRAKDIDVNKIAGTFGGGGHIKAAGATINEPVDIACKLTLEAIKKGF